MNMQPRDRIRDQMETLLNDANFEEEVLRGRVNGEIRTDDTRPFPHTIQVWLKLRDKKLSGYASATAGRWFSLSSFIELRKAPENK